MSTLIQKSLIASKKITIEADGIHVWSKDQKEELDYKIKFFELGFDIVKKTDKSNNIPFYFFLLFDVMMLGLLINSFFETDKPFEWLFWVFGLLFFVAITVWSFLKMNVETIFLTGGKKTLQLIGDKPNKQAVDDFIGDIHQAIRHYYKDTYTQFDDDVPYVVKVNQLKWLKEMKAITETEFEELSHSDHVQHVIGFQNFKNDL